ncbi:hypothetical protein ACGFZL_13150 [Streptomyces sp. NPDC048182]|uniref:hypothetical protein n=1 Tax=Streptomyces sp. NPDC048182 TaxID=3365507 RepID=UPI003721F21B
MSDNYLTVIPTDPHWQPGEEAGERAAGVLGGMLPDDDARRGLEARWHDVVQVVDCGSNLERVRCPHCKADLAFDWWGEAVSERYERDFPTLLATVPCCGVDTSLNDLAHAWPMGFARFRVEVLYPGRAWLTDAELAAVAEVLGHPVRQILSHY